VQAGKPASEGATARS